MDFTKVHKYLMDDLGDRRVKNWLFMSDFTSILIILVTYLFIVKKAGPQFMENRKPFNIKKIIQFYNAFQVIVCILLTYGIATHGWVQKYTIYCEPVDYSDDPMAVGLAEMVWWTVILKMVELIETIFFVMRKKYNQVSNLHLYHHTSTLILAWFGCKYVAGGMATFPIMINNTIHVVMYCYYYLSTCGPSWQKRLDKWKNKITIMQMIQFCILFAHGLQAFKPDCNVPILAALLYTPNIILVFYLFYDFYKNNYLKPKTAKKIN